RGRRFRLLPPTTCRRRRERVRAPEAADDGSWRGDARCGLRGRPGRPADHARRTSSSTPVDRRAPAAVERPPRRHEPHRPAPHPRVPGRAVYAAPTSPAGGETGYHGLGADPRPRAPAVGRANRAGRLVRRAPLAVARPQDPRADAARALRRDVQGRDRRLARVIFFSGENVRAAVSPERALEAVREAFVAYARGEWTMPPKVYVPAYPAGDFRAMPALGAGHALLKWVTSFPGNPARGLPTVTGLVLLSDADTGMLRGALDAGAVTALRTGAAAVLAAETLGRDGPAAVIGAGVHGEAGARTFVARGREAELYDVDRGRAKDVADRVGAGVAESREAALLA